MDFTGRPMGGFITIRPDGLKSGQLNLWVREAAARAESFAIQVGSDPTG